MLGKNITRTILSMTHCHILSVVSFITAPTAVVGVEEPIDVDILGKLGVNELQDDMSNRNRKYLIW
jgi:mannitol-specific phosphotransferase system IIBC component